MKTGLRAHAVIVAILFLFVYHAAHAQELMNEDQLEGQIYAPEFPAGLEWLNTLQPVTMPQLHSKVVLINFWSLSSPNCVEVLPELQKLLEKYAQELIVVGVHSPSYPNEKNSDVIRQAILYHQIDFPVINDSGLQMWNEYGIKTRPAFVLVNPSGRVIGVHSGTGVYELFDGIIAQAIAHFDVDKLIGRHRISFISEVYRQEKQPLNFPSKIVADTGGARLFISDSGNHRILVCNTDGKLEFVIGSGRKGNQDGSFTEAQFSRPQGLALDGDHLYVADSENGTIRTANLKTKKVTTILGASTEFDLPWDLIALNGKLYITMAGSNQIWVVDLSTFEARPFAGSGQKGHLDGVLLEAELSQPSGITTDGTKLFFVDSESGSIRSIDPDAGRVETIVGAGLQFPQGITYYNGLLYVADSYNHQIKVIDPTNKSLGSLAGSGNKGLADGAAAIASFFEPTGLAVAGRKLFVADCNNQQVRVIDTTAKRVSSWQLTNLGAIARQTMANFDGKEVKLPPAKLKSGAGKISIALMMPDGYRMLEQGALFVNFRSSNSTAVMFAVAPKEIIFNQSTGEFEIPVNGVVGMSNVTIEIAVYMQKEGSATCYYDMIRANVPVTIEKQGSAGFGVGVKVSALPRM